MYTTEEALVSTDPKLVKRLRGSSSTQVLCNLNILIKALANRKDGQFDFENISPQLVVGHKSKLLSHFEMIQKLHERYIVLRETGVAEEQVIREDIDFLS